MRNTRPPVFCWALKQILQSATKYEPKKKHVKDEKVTLMQDNSEHSDEEVYEPTSRELIKELQAEMDVRDCSKLRILSVTFNMAGVCPKGTDILDDLLQKENVEHDLYFIATQEACRPIS